MCIKHNLNHNSYLILELKFIGLMPYEVAYNNVRHKDKG